MGAGAEVEVPLQRGRPKLGAFAGGADGSSTLDWSSPLSGGSFSVGVSGRIRRTGGGGPGGGGGAAEEKEVDGAWSGAIEDVLAWSSEPALPSGQIQAFNLQVPAGGRVTLQVIGLLGVSDSDTWTNLAGKSKVVVEERPMKFRWSAGGQGGFLVQDLPATVWKAPGTVPSAGLDVTILCSVDDIFSDGETGVQEPDTGSRNDAPLPLLPITIHVVPLTLNPTSCGEWKHHQWVPATTVTWTVDARGYPSPQTPNAFEHIKWEDPCDAANVRTPKSELRLYQRVRDVQVNENGNFFREVEYVAYSSYGGPSTTVLRARHPIPRFWQNGPGLTGGTLSLLLPNLVLKPGETLAVAVSAATDLDEWFNGSSNGQETDSISYTWSSSAGSFEGGAVGQTVTYKAPSEAEVPAGPAGLAVTLTCSIDDGWSDAQTGVAAPDLGARNDGPLAVRTFAVSVVRAPCGRWEHHSWQPGTINWRVDPEGTPEPIAPTAVETVKWVDDCAGTTRPNETRVVPYTLLSDEPTLIDDVWHRQVKYRVFSTCPQGEASPAAAGAPLTGQRPLPRIWKSSPGLDGGTIISIIQGVDAETDTVSFPPGSTGNLTLNAGVGLEVSIMEANDWDSFTRWRVPEELWDEEVNYSWTIRKQPTSPGGPLGPASDLGTESKIVWSTYEAGTYVLSAEVDDSWSGTSTGVTAPDRGTRNDTRVTFTVAVEVVTKEWTVGTSVARNFDGTENGRMLSPQDQRGPGLNGVQNVIRVSKGATIACELETATDFDYWIQGGSSGSEKDSITYLWTASSVGGIAAGEFSRTDGATSTWKAPQETGQYILKCAINDLPNAVGVGESGSRDDEPVVVRTVIIEVVTAPTVTFGGSEITSGELRACAGGIDDSVQSGTTDPQFRAHVRNITATLNANGNTGVTNVRFVFSNNIGHDYGTGAELLTARLYDSTNGAQRWPEELTRDMGGQNILDLSIKSGDVVSRPTLQALWTDAAGEEVLIGSLPCNFSPVKAHRGFGTDNEPDTDSGWKFDDSLLFEGKGDTSPGKIWLKIQKDPNVPVDTEYFQNDGTTIRQPTDHLNWIAVRGHRLKVRISEVVLLDGSTVPPERFSDFLSLVAEEGGLVTDQVSIETRIDGSNQVWLRSGERIRECKSVTLLAEEQTQHLD